MRAFRSLEKKIPKPRISILSPRAKAWTFPPIIASKTSCESVRVNSQTLLISLMRSSLVRTLLLVDVAVAFASLDTFPL